MNTDLHRLDRVTEQIIGCAFQVANGLGSGFLEKVYENALVIELLRAGLRIEQQKSIPVLYRKQVVGDYIADLLIENSVLVELKATKLLDEIHMAQCLNYLRAANLRLCLLINFGRPKIEVKRIINGF
ncbi:MAG: GxxExxY protein [SAR324 cluster bacterium]|nr:GxxExxY protein [SAR324 cluster bacterium]